MRFSARALPLLLVVLLTAAVASAAKAPKIKIDHFRETWERLSPEERTAVIARYGIKQTALYLNRSYQQTLDRDYKVEIPSEKKTKHIRNQKSSGRCWIFGTVAAIEGKEPLSQSFVNFYAWKKRAEHMLARALRNQKPLTYRTEDGFGEGGWSPHAAQLIAEYGISPKEFMPDTADAGNSGTYIAKLTELIASAQMEARKLPRGAAGQAARQALGDRYRAQINQLLEIALGKPPEKFVVDGKEYTPKSYADDRLGFRANDFVMLTRYSQHKMAFNQRYTLKQPLGFEPLMLHNVSKENFMAAIRTNLDRGRGVPFSTKMGGENPYIIGTSDRVPTGARNALHLAAFDYGSVIPDLQLSFRTLGDSRLNETNHLMIFTGYDYEDSDPSTVTKLKVDNSWGTAKRKWDGHQHIYADYFDHYVDTIFVRRDSLPQSLLEKLEQSAPKKLPITIE
jgi:bleomycin hydrolase